MQFDAYTVYTHSTGCKVIEGKGCPDFVQLLHAWKQRAGSGEEILHDFDLARKLTKLSGYVPFFAVCGTLAQLIAYRKLLLDPPSPERSDI